MAKPRSVPRHNDRIVNKVTGETATIIDVHEKTTPKGSPPNYTVLLDTGLRIGKLWMGADVEWSPPPGKRRCFRCGAEDHWAPGCPAGEV